MLVGAFFGVVAADQSHSVVVALVAAMAVGAGLAAIHAVAAIHLGSDQIVSGMALNILALGLTSYLDYQFYGTTGTPSDLAGVPDIEIAPLAAVPFIGDVIAHQNAIVWAGLALVVLIQVFLFRTVPGLRLRAVGEHPRAAETVGHGRHDRRARLHRTRGDDLRTLDARRRARGIAHLRIRDRAVVLTTGSVDR